jgi:SulP family sulfate permease
MLGGIPGAQATIRSVLLIKEKAQTRLAGVFVGICTLIMLFVFQGRMQYIALAIFVGVLLKA